VLSVEDLAEIRRLHRAEGLPIKMIARRLGASRNMVRAAIARDDAPKCRPIELGATSRPDDPNSRAAGDGQPSQLVGLQSRRCRISSGPLVVIRELPVECVVVIGKGVVGAQDAEPARVVAEGQQRGALGP